MDGSVTIVGAGPSGSAAAICLARKGVAVTLIDKHEFPRDKSCGDALIPDAMAALAELGLIDQVRRDALKVPFIRLYAPNRSSVDVRGDLACMPRERLDNLLLQNAVALGADFVARASFRGAIVDDGRVVGIRMRTRSGAERELRSDYTVLATGAVSEALQRAGICLRQEPSGVALRAYYELPPSLADEMRYLAISFEEKICPGYGWIFAGPDNVFNMGVGFFYDSKRRPPTENLRELWQLFLEEFEPARRIRQSAKQLRQEQGAPLRTALEGAQFGMPGLFVIGEAAGTTYSLSGEGIGKAMQSGIVAAQCILAGNRNHRPPEEVYQQRLMQDLNAQYRAYKTAQDWLSSPLVCNLIAFRANRGRYVKEKLEALLAETADPLELFSLPGMMKAMLM